MTALTTSASPISRQSQPVAMGTQRRCCLRSGLASRRDLGVFSSIARVPRVRQGARLARFRHVYEALRHGESA